MHTSSSGLDLPMKVYNNYLVEALNVIISGKKIVFCVQLTPEGDQCVILINRLLICLVVDFLFARFPTLGKLFSTSFAICSM